MAVVVVGTEFVFVSLIVDLGRAGAFAGDAVIGLRIVACKSRCHARLASGLDWWRCGARERLFFTPAKSIPGTHDADLTGTEVEVLAGFGCSCYASKQIGEVKAGGEGGHAQAFPAKAAMTATMQTISAIAT